MPKIKAQSRLTQELLAVTDEVVWSSQIGTCAVGIKEGRATLYLGSSGVRPGQLQPHGR